MPWQVRYKRYIRHSGAPVPWQVRYKRYIRYSGPPNLRRGRMAAACYACNTCNACNACGGYGGRYRAHASCKSWLV